MKKIVLILFFAYVGIGFSQEEEKSEKSSIALVQDSNAYPNPFKDKTNISFNVSKIEEVTVSVQNILGKVVFFKKILAEQGRNNLIFYKNNLSEGIYIYTIVIKDSKISKRLVIK